MLNSLLIFIGKSISLFSRITNRGNGSTWPGHIALKTNKKFVHELVTNNPSLKVIFVAGTNGKTTTSKLIRFLLEKEGLKVFQNESGANLLNGIASVLVQHANIFGKLNYDAAIFEVDENVLPLALKEITPTAVVLLDLFRDQLDRYGEVNTIAKKWQDAFAKIDNKQGSTLIANGDDPMLTYVSHESKLPVVFFGLDESLMSKKEIPHDVDFLYCPKSGDKLAFEKMSYSHMGLFKCPKCDFEHSKDIETYKNLPTPLFGTYNIYNTNAAISVAEKIFGISLEHIQKTLPKFKAAFGRQEEIEYKGRKIIVQLSKNPAGFNQSIDAVNQSKRKYTALLVLNDRIPDGLDVSWIWDVDFENLTDARKVIVSGDRTYDMALRMQYTQKNQKPNAPSKLRASKFHVEENLEKAVQLAVNETEKDETLFILATYSGMLDTRKILSGKKIL